VQGILSSSSVVPETNSFVTLELQDAVGYFSGAYSEIL
jgi:hypothetical protein